MSVLSSAKIQIRKKKSSEIVDVELKKNESQIVFLNAVGDSNGF